jgi:hypothetical protein
MRRAHQRLLAVATMVAAGVSALAAQTPAKPAAVAGKWAVTLETEAFTANSGLELKQDAEKLTGTYTSSRYGATPLQGTIKDRAIEFSFKLSADGTDVPMTFKGEVATDGQTMKGRASISDMGEATWTAKREK